MILARYWVIANVQTEELKRDVNIIEQSLEEDKISGVICDNEVLSKFFGN